MLVSVGVGLLTPGVLEADAYGRHHVAATFTSDQAGASALVFSGITAAPARSAQPGRSQIIPPHPRGNLSGAEAFGTANGAGRST
jgi:hypothetical protein